MKFELLAKIRFEANDLDDAFLQLSEHFRKLSEDEKSDLFEVEQGGKGEISIKVIK